MSLDADVAERLKELLEMPHPRDCCYRANWLLWSLDLDGLAEAEQLAAEWDKPLDNDWLTLQRELRQEWPDPQVALNSLEPCRGLARVGTFLYSEGQPAVYALLDYAKWSNADPGFILGVMEDVWQKTEAAGEAGYAELLHKNDEYRRWPGDGRVHRNCRCFIVASLAIYTQFAPATCRLHFMNGLHSSKGGRYHYHRRSRNCWDTDTGEFAFFGVTSEAEQVAYKRLSNLSHRIYNGEWS